MRIIRVFGGCRSWESVHPVQPVPIMAIVFCSPFVVGETVVVRCEAEVGEAGGEVVVLERVVTILTGLTFVKNSFRRWRRLECRSIEKKERLVREAGKAERSPRLMLSVLLMM
jgi:hypothetical protein